MSSKGHGGMGGTGAGVTGSNQLGGADGGPRSFDAIAAQADYFAAQSKGDEEAAEYAWQQVEQFRVQQSALRRDEWKSFDDNLTEVATRSLNAIDDLRSRGLTTTTDLGTLVHEWEITDSFDDPQTDMGAETRGTDEEPNFDVRGVPLPIVHNSFHINRRKLQASRRSGQALDTVQQERATRSVAEGLEYLVFNGWDSSVGGHTVHGYRTHPDREPIVGSNWSDPAVESGTIRDNIFEGVERLESQFHPPGDTGYILYLNRASYQELRRRDTGTDQERGLLERLNEELGGDVEFKASDFLPAGEAVLVKPTQETVSLVVASDFQNVEWSSHETMTMHMKVLASITPVIRSDQAGQMGLAHYTGLAG